MKIYIVTSGEYSDYRIDKVFTDKDKAEDFANRASTSNYGEEYDVEEYDTEDDADLNLLPFTIVLQEDGVWNVRYTEHERKFCERNQFQYSPMIAEEMPDEHDTIKVGMTIYRKDKVNLVDTMTRKNIVYRPESMALWLMAKDPQSALKIAHERYGAIKAMGNVFDEDKYYLFPSYKEFNPREVNDD